VAWRARCQPGLELPLGCLWAVSRPPLGCLLAISRLSLGRLSAISRLPLGCLAAKSRLCFVDLSSGGLSTCFFEKMQSRLRPIENGIASKSVVTRSPEELIGRLISDGRLKEASPSSRGRRRRRWSPRQSRAPRWFLEGS